MISTDRLLRALDERKFGFHTGVPCSYLAGPIAELTRQKRYVSAVNEGAAAAVAAGATAAGVRSAVWAQNSGLGNLLNPLTSLLIPYNLPVLVFMSLRGWPDPNRDEPQHRVMGEATHALLDAVGVMHQTLPATAGDVSEVLDRAMTEMTAGRPTFVLVEKGALAPPATPPFDGRPTEPRRMTRAEGLRTVLDGIPNALFVSTTGYTSRELFALEDSERIFYMQGSMGHASAFGLGVALTAGTTVVVLDGDGAALMHLGTLSTIGATAPDGLVHVVFDNGSYDSTGGQKTTSEHTSLAEVGLAAGYRTAVRCRSREELTRAVAAASNAPGPHLVVADVASLRGDPPPRATSAISAPHIHARFARAARVPSSVNS